MSCYEVELQIDATVSVVVEADSEEEAITYAKETYRIGDAQWFEVTDESVKLYSEDAA